MVTQSNEPQYLIGLSLVSVAVLQLAYLHWNINGSAVASIVAMGLLLFFALPKIKSRERVLLILAIIASITALQVSDEPLQLFRRAALQAAFLISFMVLLSLLRDAAVTSQSVMTLGNFLTSRSPGRRYLAIHIGGTLLGMVLNFGAMTLLGPLIQRGARSKEGGSTLLTDWRERRQLSALIRGFSWTVAWSPATVSMAITVSVVKGANLLLVCFCGLSAAGGSLLIGWLLDRQTGREARLVLGAGNSIAVATQSVFSPAAAINVALVCVALFLISLFLSLTNNVRIVPALMFASPLVTLIWLAVQLKNSPRFVHSLSSKLKHIAVRSAPAGLPEAITLASAGYLGVVVVSLINPQWFAEVTGVTSLNEPYLYILVMGLVPILSNLALPPILSVTVIGGLYSTLPFEGVHPALLACALAWGWALNLTASPFGGVPLILGRITGIDSITLSWRWNGVFSALMFVWCSLCLTVLSKLLAVPT